MQLQEYDTVDLKKSAPIKAVVSGVSKSMYTDVKHLEGAARDVVDVIDINDAHYSAIAGTRNKHVKSYTL